MARTCCAADGQVRVLLLLLELGGLPAQLVNLRLSVPALCAANVAARLVELASTHLMTECANGSACQGVYGATACNDDREAGAFCCCCCRRQYMCCCR